MANAQAVEPTRQKPLRLWPGVIVMLQWLAWFGCTHRRVWSHGGLHRGVKQNFRRVGYRRVVGVLQPSAGAPSS